MGDLHGDLEHGLQVVRMFATHGVRSIIQLGDFGVIWPGRQNWMIDLNKLSRALARNQQNLFFVDGNHEWHPRLLQLPIGDDGYRWVTNHVAHLPRGHRTRIGGIHTLGALGGANSIDKSLRTEGKDWWAAEQITESDLERLGRAHVDVLVGHEAPMNVPTLDARPANEIWDAASTAYADQSRMMFQRGVMQTRPRLTLSGHYHRYVDEEVEYVSGRHRFKTRVVVLDMNGSERISQAILDTETLDLQFFFRNGELAVGMGGPNHDPTL